MVRLPLARDSIANSVNLAIVEMQSETKIVCIQWLKDKVGRRLLKRQTRGFLRLFYKTITSAFNFNDETLINRIQYKRNKQHTSIII